MKYELI